MRMDSVKDPLYEIIQELTIDKLLNSQIGEKLQKGVDIFKNVQENLLALYSKDDSTSLSAVKIGTVLILSVFDKYQSGKKINEFTTDDWKEIAEKVSAGAIKKDAKGYSKFVFDLYRDYISVSLAVIPEDKRPAIKRLSEELENKTRSLESDEIQEAKYIEDCMWISLEAMLKLVSAFLTRIPGGKFTEKAEAIASFAFEYARYKLYKQEQELLTQYIENQYVLDELIKNQFEAFKKALTAKSEEFKALVAGAYDPDIRTALQNTASIARSVGVPERDILDTTEKIDDYFLM